MSKIKIGKYYKFRFAGVEYQGKLIDIDKTVVGTITHIWYKCKHEDGTIYPIRKEELIEVK